MDHCALIAQIAPPVDAKIAIALID